MCFTALRLTPAERALVEQLADTEGISMSDLWRKALRAYAVSTPAQREREVTPAT